MPAYISGMVGNGRIAGAGAATDKTMNWRAMEWRFGREFAPIGASDRTRLDVIYYNEGHPTNNHRDGFAGQLVLGTRQFEAGIGPYISMNTTERGGTQENDANLGLLLSLAWRIDLGSVGKGLEMRLGFNHVSMRKAHASNALLFGVGRQFSATPAPTRDLWVGLGIGNAITNHSGAGSSYGYSGEVKLVNGVTALSLSALKEGDDGVRVDRRGVAAQAWYVQPLTQSWTLSAGLGPYYASNYRDNESGHVHALFSLQAEYALGKATRTFVSVSRVKTFGERNDRDLFRVGLSTAL